MEGRAACMKNGLDSIEERLTVSMNNIKKRKVQNRRRLTFMLVFILLICSVGIPGTGRVMAQEPVKVVVTIFPACDWVRNLLGENPSGMEVTWLFDNGVDPHSYQPSIDDIMTIASCDLFIYVGGVSDQWVESALAGAVNEEMHVIRLLDVLGENAREEELVEGMQEEEDDDSEEFDEHVWLSLKNASLFCDAISDELEKLDPDHAEQYQKNALDYKSRISELDQAYEDMVSGASRRTLLFADRFPFLYLTEDYGLDYYAAFAGCSAETEASFDTIIFLTEKVDELSLPCVLTIEGSDHKLAQTIVQSTSAKDQAILTLDSLQSVTSQDVEAGKTYLSVMEDNLAVLQEALN